MGYKRALSLCTSHRAAVAIAVMIYDFVETNSNMFAYIKKCTGE